MTRNNSKHTFSSKSEKKSKTKDGGKKPWFALLALSLLFYGAMLFLTIFAKNIHNARLPQVTAERLGKQHFSYTFTSEGYTAKRTGSLPALPKELVDTNQVFILETHFHNSKEAVLPQLNTSGAKARLYSLFLPSPGEA